MKVTKRLVKIVLSPDGWRLALCAAYDESELVDRDPLERLGAAGGIANNDGLGPGDRIQGRDFHISSLLDEFEQNFVKLFLCHCARLA